MPSEKMSTANFVCTNILHILLEADVAFVMYWNMQSFFLEVFGKIIIIHTVKTGTLILGNMCTENCYFCFLSLFF